MFELTRTEYNSLRSQFASLENGRGRFSKFNPYARELKAEIKKLEKKMNRKFKDVCEALNFLLIKNVQEARQQNRKRIGYKS